MSVTIGAPVGMGARSARRLAATIRSSHDPQCERNGDPDPRTTQLIAP